MARAPKDIARAEPKPRGSKLVRVTGRDAARQIQYARTVLETEASAILSVRERLGPSFVRAVELILACPGQVIVTGIGKPGFIAQKLSAILASTGTPSIF